MKLAGPNTATGKKTKTLYDADCTLREKLEIVSEGVDK